MIGGARLLIRLSFKITRWLWKLALWAFAFWLAGYVAILFYKKPLAQKLLRDVFQTNVTIGRVSIDLMHDFPISKISVENVQIEGTNPRTPGSVIVINNASVWINLPDLLTKPEVKRIERIAAQGVRVALEIDMHGERNFLLFRPKKRKPGKKPPKLVDLPAIELKDVSFKYASLHAGRHYEYYFDNLNAGIHVLPDSMLFEVKGGGRSDFMRLGAFTILTRTPITLDAEFTVRKYDKRLRFRKAGIILDGTALQISGSMLTGAEKSYDLKFHAPKGNLETLLNLVPKKAGKQIKVFETEGAMELNGILKGEDTDADNPLFYLGFRCAETTIRNKKTGAALTGITLRGAYSNGEKHSGATTYLSVDTISARLGSRSINGSLRLTNFKNLHIDANLDARLFAPDVVAFAGLPTAPGGSGDVVLACNIHGDFSRLSDTRAIDSLSYRGEIGFENVCFAPKTGGIAVENLNGVVRLVKRDLRADNLSGVINGQFFRFDATIDEFIPYIIKKHSVLTCRAEFDAPRFDVNAFLEKRKALAALQPKDTIHEKDVEKKPKKTVYDLPKGFSLDFHFEFGELKYNGLVFQDVRIPIRYHEQTLAIDTVRLHNADAELTYAFKLDGKDPDFVLINSLLKFNLKNIGNLSANLKPDATKNARTGQTSARGVLRAYGSLQKKQKAGDKLPSANLFFALDNGEFLKQNEISAQNPKKKGRLHIKGLGFRARLSHLSLDAPEESKLEIDSIFGIANENYYLRAALRIKDWKTKETHLSINSYLSLPIFLEYFQVENIEQSTGAIRMNLNIKGRLTQFTKIDSLLALPFKGDLKFEDVGFHFVSSGLEGRRFNGTILYDENGVKVSDLSGKIGHTDFKIKGTLKDALPYLYQKNKTLTADLHVVSDTVDVRQFLKKNAKKADSGFLLRLPKNIDLKADFKADYAYFDSLALTNINAGVTLLNGRLDLTKLKVYTCGGTATFTATLDASRPDDSIRVKASMRLRSLNVKKALSSLNNLGQAFLTDEAISGALTADLELTDVLPNTLKSDYARMNGTVHFRIHDGRFTDFEPLEKLKLLIRKKRLKSVPFTMQGIDIIIKNRTLYITEIDFRSSIINLLIQGVHRFDQKLIYKLAVMPTRNSDKVPVFPPLLSFLSQSYETTPLVFTIKGSDKKFKVNFDGKRAVKNLFGNIDVEKEASSVETVPND